MAGKDEKKIIFKSVDDLPPMAMSLGTMWVNKTASWRNLRPIIDYDKCIDCMICWKYCPEPAIYLRDPDERVAVDYDYCKGCLICVEECPVDAIYTEEEGK